MSEPRPRQRRHTTAHPWEPLTMTWREVAATVFRASEEWLHDHLAEYPDFPAADPRINVFAREAVEQWVSMRFGLDSAVNTNNDAEARIMARLNNDKNPRAISQHPTA